MKEKIILRAYTTKGLDYLDKVSDIITNSTDLRVELVNHLDIRKIIHDMIPAVLNSERWVSLDAHIAKQVGCAYYRISRVFDYDGNVVSRYEEGTFDGHGRHVRIFDTDIVNGFTMQTACEKFGTYLMTVPLRIKENEDLIDIEDLTENNSLFSDNGKLISNNYLINEKVFTKRTSLPEELYQPLRELLL